MTAAPHITLFDYKGSKFKLKTTAPDVDGIVQIPFSTDDPVELSGDVVVDTLGALNNAKVTNPDAASATIPALLRGALKQQVDILAKLLAAPATEAKQDTIITALATLPAGTNAIGAVKDNGPNWTTVWGVSAAPFTSVDQHSAVASVTDAPTGGQKIVVDDIFISVDTAMSVTFKCETSGAVILGPFYMAANSSLQIKSRGKGKKLATADKKLQVLTSVAGNIMVDVGYHSEA